MNKKIVYNKIKDTRTTYKSYVDGSIKIEREILKDKKWMKTHEFKLSRVEVSEINIIYRQHLSNRLDDKEEKWKKKLKNLLKILNS